MRGMKGLQENAVTAAGGDSGLAKAFREWSDKAETIRIVTAWATMDCAVCDSLKKSRNKK